MNEFDKRLEEAETIADVFEIVKDSVRHVIDRDRAGLMLGLADLGNVSNGFLGGYYQIASNAIIMNKNPLRRIQETNPELFKPYVFYVLLHEYLHALGVMEEARTRALVYTIAKDVFGENHIVTKMAEDITKFIPNFVYPYANWKPQNFDIELVEGFDNSSFTYIG